jgi:hypothetical protein
MSAGLASGVSSGLGQSLGTSAAGSAAGTAAEGAAADSTAGSIGYGVGAALGNSANKGAGGTIARDITNGSSTPADNTELSAVQGANSAADSSNTKGGWLGMGLFGNDKYNPNPSSYQPATGSSVSSAAMPKLQMPPSVAMAMMQQLPQLSGSI